MEDQLLTSASDVLMNTAGVTAIHYGQEGAGYSAYYSRGFEIKNIFTRWYSEFLSCIWWQRHDGT